MSSSKHKVIQRLHDMGFNDGDIRAAITECGYNTEACADFIVHRKQDKVKRPRLNVGMEVWIFSSEDNEWCPGNIVSITKQLISIIFNGHDFRWLEKESDLYKIQELKPNIVIVNHSNSNQSAMHNQNYHNHGGYGHGHYNNNNNGYGDEQMVDDPYNPTGVNDENEYAPPRPDEVDYFVTFTESVLGLELYSDEDGFNCIVGRCVSSIARQKVTPGSQIVQVNDRWLANYRFEEIRDAVKQAARSPPLAVTFRIKKNLYTHLPKQQQMQQQNTANLFVSNGYNNGYNEVQMPSQSATSPMDIMKEVSPNNHSHNNSHYQQQKEEKQEQPNIILDDDENNNNHNKNGNDDDENDFVGTLSFSECVNLQIGDHIDHRDDVGRFLLATIVNKEEYKVKIHYEGWNSKWDTWCNYKSETHRFAAPRSISRKPNTRFRDLKIRDYVDINPIQRHEGWRVGQIRRMDKYSGQAQIVYKEDGQEFLYWAHLNNPTEIAPFMTRAAEQIALQQKIAQIELNESSNNENEQHKDNDIEQVQEMHNGDEDDDDEEELDHEQINISANSTNINPLHHQSQHQHQHQHQHQTHSFVVAPNNNRNSANTKTNTEHSSRYNSAIPSNITMNTHNKHNNPEQQLFNLTHDHNHNHNVIQPPPANSLDAQHRKSRSRVLPRSLKNKKLPPKPQKNPNKLKQQRMNNPPPPPAKTNFSDLNFNVPQNYSSPPKSATSANFQHGQTMYTAQW